MNNKNGQGLKAAIDEHFNIMAVVKGIIISYIVTLLIFALFAFILSNTDFPEKYITPVVIITTIISVLIAGSITARTLKSRGWVNGSVVGMIYIAVLYLVSSVANRNFGVDRYVITMLLVGIFSGAIGGIIGVNLRFGSHSRVKIKKVR